MQSVLGSSRKSDIVFRNNGMIDITSRVAQLLNLKRGDVIDLLDDRERGYGSIYIYVRHRAPLFGNHEAVVSPTKNGSSNFRTYSKKLSRFVTDANQSSGNKTSCWVGSPVDLGAYGIGLPLIIIN